MKIPCDTIARLSHLLPAPEAEIEESFRCFRLDNGKVIVSNRRFMAIERVGDFDKWPAIVGQCIDPLTESKGPMVFDSHQLFALAQAAPSGAVSLEQCADPDNRPTVVRDIESADWVGFFLARISDGRQHVGASVPGWCK